MSIIRTLRRAFAPKRELKFYPVGTRVRVIRCVYLPQLLGMTGTVIGDPKPCETPPLKFLWWERTHRWVGQYVAIDTVGCRMRDPWGVCWYAPSPDCIEPIEDGQCAEAQITEALTRIAKQSQRGVIEQVGPA
jgi:hypothetical protein